MKRLLFFAPVIASVLLTGCMSNVYVQALQPAQISMPQHFQKIAVVERVKPTKQNQAVNIIEGVLTGEGLQADREGGVSCLSGLKTSLLKTPRYTVAEAAGVDLRGTGTGEFPPALTWEEVAKICEANGAEALVVLEAFDSNSGIKMGTRPRKVKSKEGVETTVTEHVANMRMTITSAWRVYDYKNKIIVDEFRGDDFLDFVGAGATPDQAMAALPMKREAIKRTGFHAGSSYGYRIAPQWVTLHREYYTKGSDALKKARRFVRLNDWKGAAEIWKTRVQSSNRKEAGRATYNMAVASEVLGNLEAAKEWAVKAYKEKGNKKGLAYSRQLERRIRDSKVLDEQMKSGE